MRTSDLGSSDLGSLDLSFGRVADLCSSAGSFNLGLSDGLSNLGLLKAD